MHPNSHPAAQLPSGTVARVVRHFISPWHGVPMPTISEIVLAVRLIVGGAWSAFLARIRSNPTGQGLRSNTLDPVVGLPNQEKA